MAAAEAQAVTWRSKDPAFSKAAEGAIREGLLSLRGPAVDVSSFARWGDGALFIRWLKPVTLKTARVWFGRRIS